MAGRDCLSTDWTASERLDSPTSWESLFVDRLPREKEFETSEEFGAAIAHAVDSRSAEVFAEHSDEGWATQVKEVPMEVHSRMEESTFMKDCARRGIPVVFRSACGGWDTANWTVNTLKDGFGPFSLSVRRFEVGSDVGGGHSRKIVGLGRREGGGGGGRSRVSESGDRTRVTTNGDGAATGGDYGDIRHSEFTMDAFITQALGDHKTAPGKQTCSEVKPNEESEEASDSESPWYGANNFIPPPLLANIHLPPYYPRHCYRLADTRLWVGGAGTGAPLHRDLQDNFILQILGRKTLALYPPHASEHFTGAWFVTPYLQSAGQRAQTPLGRNEASLKEDNEIAQTSVSGECVLVELAPTDLLFLPAGWWHETRNSVYNSNNDCPVCQKQRSVSSREENRSENDGENIGNSDVTRCDHCGISCSINYFMSACFASVGVLCPQGIAENDWPIKPNALSALYSEAQPQSER